MEKIDLQGLRWRLNKCLLGLGFWGVLGAAILLFSLITYFTKVTALDAQIKAAENRLIDAKTNIFRLAPHHPPQEQTAEQEVAKFYNVFSSKDNLPNSLSLINQIAIKRHLMLIRGDYKLAETKQGQLSRYEIVFPVNGSYSQIRHFIADVMFSIPSLALNDLQIKRENTLTSTVEAKMIFVLFLQGESL